MKRLLTVWILILSLLVTCTSCVLPEGLEGSEGKKPEASEGATLKNTVAATKIPLEESVQYQTLSDSEKAAYKALVSAIATGTAEVSVADLSLDQTAAEEILRKVTADHPQYFYLSKASSFTFDPETQKVQAFTLSYTDGTAVDEYGDEGRTKTANRAEIDRQIAEFNAQIRTLLQTVPASASELETEKFLHDAIIDRVSYDTAAAEGTFDAREALPRAYDAYGALCKGTATCEGYAKLFQYLCHSVGIQATQIIGDADGTPHMWNAVCIDGLWYQTDVTWDDPKNLDRNVAVYEYFNLPSSEMERDHTPDLSLLTLPECTSDTHSFRNTYAVVLKKNGEPADGYAEAVTYAVRSGEDYLIFYTADVSDLNDALVSKVLADDSQINRTLRSLSRPALEATQVFSIGSYTYIPLG